MEITKKNKNNTLPKAIDACFFTQDSFIFFSHCWGKKKKIITTILIFLIYLKILYNPFFLNKSGSL